MLVNFFDRYNKGKGSIPVIIYEGRILYSDKFKSEIEEYIKNVIDNILSIKKLL